MDDTNETRHILALSLVPGIGLKISKKIISHYGSASAFFEVAPELRIPGVKNNDLSKTSLTSFLLRADDELSYCAKNEIVALNYLSNDFPRRLSLCEDAPLVIYLKGEMDLNAKRVVAIVGSRKASFYGKNACDNIVKELKNWDCSLISGLAHGIDSYAHRAAQEQNIQNIGVVAHGLDKLYPSTNSNLAKAMEAYGGIVSEFPTGTNPDRENFPKRNRIIAGLSDAVIVVEAAKKGGALITADYAQGYNRDVFAVPGRISDPSSEGCNRLIKNNKAALLSSPADLAWYMQWKKKSVQQSLFQDVSAVESNIISSIIKGANHPDLMTYETGFSLSEVNSILLGLEFKGIITSLPGKKYQLIG